jgi:hypothetical protein
MTAVFNTFSLLFHLAWMPSGMERSSGAVAPSAAWSGLS